MKKEQTHYNDAGCKDYDLNDESTLCSGLALADGKVQIVDIFEFNFMRYMLIAIRIVIGTLMLYLSSAGSYDIQHTGPPAVSCRSEQCVSDILSALLLSVEECLRDQPVSSIHRVSVCGQMHGVMLWCKG